MIEPNDEKVMPGVQVTRYEAETLYHAMLRDLASRQADSGVRLEILAVHLGRDLENDFEPLYQEAYAKSRKARMSTAEPGYQGGPGDQSDGKEEPEKMVQTGIPGVTTGDKAPPPKNTKAPKSQPIGPKDIPFLDDCRAQVQAVKSFSDLQELWESVEEKRQEIQDELKPYFMSKKREFFEEPIVSEDMPFIDHCLAQLQRAVSISDLTRLWGNSVATRRQEVKNHLKPFFTERQGKFFAAIDPFH